ncbi:MAG TPA: PadR family transcriptional regulator [Aestuariivirga sp.]|nr:PadR family transcriptional regulator [Aestuariivirga sp.]
MNVRTLCLGILSIREASGYEIKKEIEDGSFSYFIEASFGSIYPALTQLLKDGLVSVRAEEQAGRPDKKVYAITEAGRRTLPVWLAVEPAPDKYKSEFLFMMLMQDHIDPARRFAAMDLQITRLRADLDSLHCCRAEHQPTPAGEFVSGYGEAVLTAALAYVETHRARLVAAKPAEAAA